MKNLILLTIAVLTQSLAPLPGQTDNNLNSSFFNRKYKNWENPTKKSGLFLYKKHYIENNVILNKEKNILETTERSGYRWYINVHLVSYFLFSFVLYLMLCAYRVTHAINTSIREDVGYVKITGLHTGSIVFAIVSMIFTLATFTIYHIKNIDGNRDFLINSFYTYLPYYIAMIMSFIALSILSGLYTKKYTEYLNKYFFIIFTTTSLLFMSSIVKESGLENIGWFLFYEFIILLFLIPRAFDITIADLLIGFIDSIKIWFWKIRHNKTKKV